MNSTNTNNNNNTVNNTTSKTILDNVNKNIEAI